MPLSFKPIRALLFLLVLLSGFTALAQTTGRIVGQVTDQDGKAVADADVQVLSLDGSVNKQLKTDATGGFIVPDLPPGDYNITVQREGFQLENEAVSVVAGKDVSFTPKLSVEKKAEVVTVTGGPAAGVELDTSSNSTTLSGGEVKGLPLNGRNFSQLITMAPGVSNQTGQDEAKVGVAGSAKFSVNGGRVEYNTFEVDGSDVLNTSINASRGQGEPLVVYPSIDAILDMKVLTSNYSAAYGKSASGSVLVSTKSGTADLHGNLYEFIRNEAFNARNYFDQPGRTPLYRRQDFGGTVGGPLFIPKVYNTKKDKTFFFFSEEARLEKTPVDYNQAVPTTAERSGNFSDVCPAPTPLGPGAYNASAYPDCPFQKIGQTAYVTVAPSALSTAILNTGIIPEPNATQGCNTTNPTAFPRCYIASISPSTYWREELFRIDHNVTPSQQVSFRYIHDTWHTTTLTPQWGIVQNSFPTIENSLQGPGLDLSASLTQSLPHSFLNRIVAAYTVEHISLEPKAGPGLNSFDRPEVLNDPAALPGATPAATGAGAVCSVTNVLLSTGSEPADQCPMGYIFNNGFNGNRLPGLVFQGTNGAYGGHGFNADTGYAPWHQDNPRYDVRDDASKPIGNHLVQFGFEGTLVQQNELSAVSGTNSGDRQGLLTFSNQQSLYTSGNAFADFLAGPGVTATANNQAYATTAIKSFTQDSGQLEYHTRYKSADLYLQDDWKISPRLTINAGFRASLFGNWYNPYGTAYNWTPGAYDQSLGSSVYINANYGYLASKATGNPVPLGRTGPYGLSNLNPAITNGLRQCSGTGSGSLGDSCMKSQIFNPAPRFGLSWDPSGNGKTAIRAGYGLYWEHGTGYEANVGSLNGSAPLILSETQSNVNPTPATGTTQPNTGNSVGAYGAIGYSCQGGTTQCGNLPIPTAGASFPLNVTSIPAKAVYTYTQQWSLSLQRELRRNMLAQLAYVGAKGTHLTAVQDLNQLQPLSGALNPFKKGQPITSSVCSSGANGNVFSTQGTNPVPPTGPGIVSTAGIGPTSPGYINMIVACTGNPGFAELNPNIILGISADDVRPYPGFSNIISVSNVADSQYHALQGTFREVTGALTVALSYTYSHSLDDSSDRSSANFANSLDIKSNWASSDFDQRQLFNVSYIYELPFLQMLHGFTNLLGPGDDTPAKTDAKETDAPPAILKNVLGGWELSGITTHQTGTPFSVINGGGSNGTGAADNAGVGDGLGIGSYVDVVGNARGIKPTVGPGANVGPLLLNPGAFTAPAGLTFGNSGRNSLNNPGRTNFNASLLKNFKTANDRLNFEFRAEGFNIFNHTQFRIYDPAHAGSAGNNVANCYGGIATGYSAAGGVGTDCLDGNSFLHPIDAHDPRILQFGLKMAF